MKQFYFKIEDKGFEDSILVNFKGILLNNVNIVKKQGMMKYLKGYCYRINQVLFVF